MYQPLTITTTGPEGESLTWSILHSAVEGYRRVFGQRLSLVEAEEGIERMLATARPARGGTSKNHLERWRAGRDHHRAQLIVEPTLDGNHLRLIDVQPPYALWRPHHS